MVDIPSCTGADFLNQNHNCVPRFLEEVGAAAAFFDGQVGVALDRGIPIQCVCAMARGARVR